MEYAYIVQKSVDRDHYEIMAVTSTLEKAVEALKVKSGFGQFIFDHYSEHSQACFPLENEEKLYFITKTMVDDPYFFIKKEEKE